MIAQRSDTLTAGLGGDTVNLAMAHLTCIGGQRGGGERAAQSIFEYSVPAGIFPVSAHYVALGHLHRPQRPAHQVAYSGSLMKYSFSEAAGTRSVSVVDMDSGGGCQIERIALAPRRDVRTLTGTLAELLEGPKPGESADDYLMVTLKDRGALLDPMVDVASWLNEPTEAPWVLSVWLALKFARAARLSKNVRLVAFVVISRVTLPFASVVLVSV